MIASAECVSGAVDSQNAAIYDGIPGAAGSVHLQDAPNSPVNTARSHISTAQSVEAEEASTRPAAADLANEHLFATRSVEGDSAASVAPDDGAHSSLGASQLATAHDRAVSSFRRSASPSPSANTAPQQQRSLASHPHAAPPPANAPGPSKTRMSQSAVSREHSTGHPAVAHAPASVYAQDGLLNGLAAAHRTALNALHTAAHRQSEVGQSPNATLSDVSLGFPQLRAHAASAADVLAAPAPTAPNGGLTAQQPHHAVPAAVGHDPRQPRVEQPQAATVTTGASLSEGKTVAMHPGGGAGVHVVEAAMSSQAHAQVDVPQQAVLAQLQAALHQQLHCQVDGRQSGGGSALSGQDPRVVNALRGSPAVQPSPLVEGTASAVLLPFTGGGTGVQSVLQRMGSYKATSAAHAASAGGQAPRGSHVDDPGPLGPTGPLRVAGSPSAPAASVEAVMQTTHRGSEDNQSLSQPDSHHIGVASVAAMDHDEGAGSEGAASMLASEVPLLNQRAEAEGEGGGLDVDGVSMGHAPQTSAIVVAHGGANSCSVNSPCQDTPTRPGGEGEAWGATLAADSAANPLPPPHRQQPHPQASGNAVASVSLPSRADRQLQGTAKGARSAAGATSRMSWQRPGADSCDDEAASQRVAGGAGATAQGGHAAGNSNSFGDVRVAAAGTPSAVAEADAFSDGRPASPALSLRRGAASHVAGGSVGVGGAGVALHMAGGSVGVLERVWDARPAASTEAVLEDLHDGLAYAVEAVSHRKLGAQSFTAPPAPGAADAGGYRAGGREERPAGSTASNACKRKRDEGGDHP